MKPVTDTEILSQLEGLTPVEDPDLLSQLNAGQSIDHSEGVGPVQAALISTGRGFYTVGRGIGLIEPEDETEAKAYEALTKRYPKTTTVGEIVGESAPFAVLGGPIGAIKGTAGRVLAAGTLGALEGGVLANAKDQDVLKTAGVAGSVSAIAEYAIPVAGRILGKAYRKLRGKAPLSDLIENGIPTPEAKEVMDELGVTADDLNAAAMEFLKDQPRGVSREQAVRASRFESLGAPFTKGDISQDFAQKAAEARLVESSADTLGDPLRSLRMAQSDAFTSQLNKAISETGVPDDVGESIKKALSSRVSMLRTEKNALYKQAFESASDIGPIPIPTNEILSAVPDDKIMRRISALSGSQVDATKKLLVEFGIDQSPEAVESFLKSGGIIEPLNVGNLEDFRSFLNIIERSDNTNAASVIIGPIKQALDDEALMIDDAIKASGISGGVLDTLKQARGKVRTLKTEFSPQSITGRLVDVKKDGVTPIIEASKVYKEIVGSQRPIEYLERTMTSLGKAKGGKEAIGNLQAATILDLVDHAYKAQTRRIGGNKVFGATAFNNRLEAIGEDRLKLIFKDKPGILNRIKSVGKAAQDATASGAEMPKGSATTILDTLNKMGLFAISSKVPGMNLLAESIRLISASGKNRKILESAMKNKPDIERVINEMSVDFPNIFAIPVGVSAASQPDENE